MGLVDGVSDQVMLKPACSATETSYNLRNFYEESLDRGSYMSAHVLLNLLNELGKSDKMRGLPSIFLLFRSKFNKFNKT